MLSRQLWPLKQMYILSPPVILVCLEQRNYWFCVTQKVLQENLQILMSSMSSRSNSVYYVYGKSK